MSESLDENLSLKEKRGGALKVYAILSWIYIGLTALGLLMSMATGPMSVEELEQSKVILMESWDEETIQLIGTDLLNEMVLRLDIANEKHYLILGFNFAIVVLGFYGVLQMFQLKKTGYYFYLAYSALPAIVEIMHFGTGTLAIFNIIFGLLVSGIFCLLYGLQLKRMQ
ncbi:MAG: hypothetical protein IPM74_07225 [Crocinitomicaceae bacterium]|nr:hypothetical protein [Crocinitomicaceae bacterium]MBK8925691.1 hypothetical protein [Crocinitomicaceae bacterium]